MNASNVTNPTSEPESNATQGDIEQSCETTLSNEHLESIALQALAAAPAARSYSNRGRSDDDRQAALGKHPNIAARLDAGTTENSQPQSVLMDIEGQRIDDYCDSRRLAIPARLRLFAQVCRAVHFAHQHAVIHRGLNPTNILVAADGVPKLRNFGSSRVVQPKTAAGNDGTGTVGAITGTLTQSSELPLASEYASPEQLKGETITTASDIYTLGVILYHLLTGRSPYRLKTGTSSEVFQAVFEQAPEKPSSAVTHCPAALVDLPRDEKPKSAEAVPGSQPTEPDLLSTLPRPVATPENIALARDCSPHRLKHILSGDLDAIVLTALRKEPERRYASAERFADDLDHYLHGMPVRAHDDSTVYRCGKFARRHAAVVTIGFLLVVALLIVVTRMTTELILARRQRDRIDTSFHQTHEVIDQILARIRTERLLNQPGFYPLRAALLQDAQRFYKDFLTQHGSDATIRPELTEASGRLARITSLIGSPSEAVFQNHQAVALWEKLLLEDPANRHYQEELAATLSDLGMALMPVREQLDEAMHALRRAQELIEPLVAVEPQSVAKRQELALILLNIAQIQSRQDHPEEALDSIDRVLELELQLAAEDSRSLEPRIALATAYATAGRTVGAQTGELYKALAFYHLAIELHDAIAREHPELADQSYQFALELSELSTLQRTAGQLDLAFQNLHRSLSIVEQLDQSHPGILIYQTSLGSIYNLMSDLQRQRAEAADSLALAQKARVLFERLVSEHPQNSKFRIELATSYNNLGRQFQQTGEFAEALQSFQRAMDLYESLPDLDPQTAYKLACNVSRCIPLFGIKNQATDSRRAALELSKSDRVRRQFYGDRAIAASAPPCTPVVSAWKLLRLTLTLTRFATDLISKTSSRSWRRKPQPIADNVTPIVTSLNFESFGPIVGLTHENRASARGFLADPKGDGACRRGLLGTAIAAKVAMTMDWIRRLVWPAILLFAAGTTASGCCRISALSTSSRQLRLRAAFHSSPGWSASTSTLLEHLGLRELAQDRPCDTFRLLEQPTDILYADPQRLLALAELAYQISEGSTTEDAIAWARDAAVYSTFYLAEPTDGHYNEPLRCFARGVHNRAVARCLRLAQTDVAPAHSAWPAQLAQAGIIPTSTWADWSTLGVDSLQATDQAVFRGKSRSEPRAGLGVPLIVHRVLTNRDLAEWKAYGPGKVVFAATAVVQPRGSVTTWRNQPVELMLVDPFQVEALELGGTFYPLAQDLTAPLALRLAQSGMRNYEFLGVVSPRLYATHAGVYPVDPYQPGKVPVVFVQGLWTGPGVWAPMLDALRKDPMLRASCQFWVVLYPSGYPLPLAAQSLRQSLREIRQRLDPDQVDRCA